ncbi:MAG: YIP1 family protein, partial [Methanosarcinales archaeon]|nr:YIP1 family protein [Methanosarcinales archaeon]
MSPTKSFLKNYLPTARSVITHPRQFFRDMPTSGPLKEPLVFAVLTIFIVSLLYIPIDLISWAPLLPLGSDMVLSLIIMGALFLYTLFIMLISIPINSILYHILLKIFGAKGSLEATLRVFCYYLAISLVVLPVAAAIVIIFYLAEVTGAHGILFQILAVVLLLAMTIPVFYSFYVLFVGFSEVHQISMKRVILALLILPIVLFLILAIIVVGLVFIANYSTSMGSMPPPGDYPYTGYGQPYTSPVIPNITAAYGTHPVVDGRYNFDEDKWYETQDINFTTRGVPYT